MYAEAMVHLRRGSENGAGGDFGKANSDYLIGLTCLMDAIKIEPSTEKRDNMKHIMETFLKRAELFKKAKDSGVSLGGGKAVQNILDEKQIGVAAAIESKEPNSSHSLVEKQEEKAATLSEEESDEPREPRPAPDVVAATPEEPVPTPPVRPPRPALFQTPAASDNDEDNFLLPEVFSPAAEEVESPPPIPPRPPHALSPSKKRQLAVEAKAKADDELQKSVENGENSFNSSCAITDDEIMAQLLVTARPPPAPSADEDPVILTVPDDTRALLNASDEVVTTPRSRTRKAQWRDTPDEDRQSGVIVHEASKSGKKERTPRKNRRKGSAGSSERRLSRRKGGNLRPMRFTNSSDTKRKGELFKERMNYNRPSGGSRRKGSSSSGETKVGKEFENAVQAEIMNTDPGVVWDDVAGLVLAKQALQEAVILPMLRPDIFNGIRAPSKGVLLYGPPGTGKTMLAKAVASESNATFFSISASSLTSKWVGESSKLVRALFNLANKRAPAVVFIDEIDSVLSARSSGEHNAGRQLKTEFLVQFDGARQEERKGHVLFIGATNRPWDLDEAVIRRLAKRVYIPLPDESGRLEIFKSLMEGQNCDISGLEWGNIVTATEGYSGSDLKELCHEAALGPIRGFGMRITEVEASELPPVTVEDFRDAIQHIRPSVGKDDKRYEKWTEKFGTR